MKPAALPVVPDDSSEGAAGGAVGADGGSGLLEHALTRKSELAAITAPAVFADFNSECMLVIVRQLLLGCKLRQNSSKLKRTGAS